MDERLGVQRERDVRSERLTQLFDAHFDRLFRIARRMVATSVVGNDDIARAWVVESAAGEFAVGVQFLPDGAGRLSDASRRHAGHPVAVLIDGRVVMAPTVRSPMGESATITGSFTRAEAERVAKGMTNR